MTKRSAETLAEIENHARKFLGYDQNSGHVFWRATRRGSHLKPGDSVGRINQTGYLELSLLLSGKRVLVKVHRLAWFMHYGSWPDGHIDHIDHVRTNNRISNLRCVDDAENMRNMGVRKDNVSGFVGVSWHKKSGKWTAQYRLNGKVVCLGFYDCKISAAEVVARARSESGYHRNHGKDLTL